MDKVYMTIFRFFFSKLIFLDLLIAFALDFIGKK